MKKIVFAALAVFALCSCTPTKTLYSWHDYENTSYEYNKEHTDKLRGKVLEQFVKMTSKQKGTRGVVPPGLYAEYGYFLYNTGKTEEGIQYLKKEIEQYPESEQYISRIVKQLEK